VKLNKFKVFYFNVLPNLLLGVGILFLVMSFGPVVYGEVWYRLKEFKNQYFTLNKDGAVEDSVFSRFLSTSPILIEPVNKDFSLVIEEIGVNAPVVANVSVTDENAYNDSLSNGIAHAITSDLPTDSASNVYLFAHASLDFWNLGKYATVFNLLRKLDEGDRIHVFYEGRDYVYETINNEIYKGWNTYPLTRTTIEPILTLQTCDPPGTTLNRLVVTAKLIEINE
jgi:sortase A